MRYLWLHYLYNCRLIHQDGNSFEGKSECIMNNDGTESYYKQGVHKYLNEVYEGSRINKLWNGKGNWKWENEDREISEWLNDKSNGPSMYYYFDSKVKMIYYSNDEEIFLQ